MQEEKQTETTKPKDPKNSIKAKEEFSILKQAGKLRFKELKSPARKFNQISDDPVTVIPKITKTSQATIITTFRNSFKVYQIDENCKKIKFVSAHTCNLPFSFETAALKQEVTRTHIRYFIKTKGIKRTNGNSAFFRDNDIDRAIRKTSYLVFEVSHARGQPEILEPIYLGQFRQRFRGFEKWKINFCSTPNQNVFYNQKHRLVKAESSRNYSRVIYIVEIAKGFRNLTKRVFEFKLANPHSKAYKTKLDRDSLKIEGELRDAFNFFKDTKPFYLIGSEDTKKRGHLRPFVKIDYKMIIVGLMNVANKKIVLKRFISIFELFEGLNLKILDTIEIDEIVGCEYSDREDCLFLDVDPIFEYLSKEEHPEFADLIDEALRVTGERRRQVKVTKGHGMDPEMLSMRRRLTIAVKGCFRGREREIKISQRDFSMKLPVQNSGGKVLVREVQREMRTENQVKNEKLHRDAKMSKIEEGNQPLKKKYLRAVKSEKKKNEETPDSGRSTVSISLDEILEQTGLESECSIRSAHEVDEDTLLIISSTKMLLIDLKSKRLLSAYEYSNNVPKNIKNLVIKDDLILTPNMDKGCIEAHKIVKTTNNELSFEPLGILDLKVINEFHSIKELGVRRRYRDEYSMRDHTMLFARVDDNTYESKIGVNWMETEGSALTTPVFLSVRFKIIESLNGNGETRVSLESWSVDYKVNRRKLSGVLYFKEGFWNYPMRGKSSEFLSIQVSGSPSSKVKFGVLPEKILKNKKICKVFTLNNFAYILFRCESWKQISLIEYKQKAQIDQREYLRELKSFQLTRKAEVYFDRTTVDAVRAYCLIRSRSKSTLKVIVLNQDLEVLKKFKIFSVNSVWDFTTIGLDIFSFNSPQDEDDRHGGSITNFLVDYQKRRVEELVVGDGDEVLHAKVHGCLEGESLIAFTKGSGSKENSTSDGIFLANRITVDN